MKRILVLISTSATLVGPAFGYVSYTGGAYSDSLDSLGASSSWVNDVTAPGWYAFQSNVSGGTVLSNNSDDAWSAVSDYVLNDGQPSTGALLNLGVNSSSSDRAIGSLSQGHDFCFALVLKNNSAVTFDGFEMSYYGEQWQVNSQVSDPSMILDFSFGVFGSLNVSPANPNTIVPNPAGNPSAFYSGYTNPANNALDFSALVFGSTILPLNGNDSANRAMVSSSQALVWSPGEFLVLRWFDDYTFGRTQARLAVDNVQFAASAIPEPASFCLTLLGMAAVIRTSMILRRPGQRGARNTLPAMKRDAQSLL